MRLKNISISNFRNIGKAYLEPGRQFNLFYGLNGQGKTNFLEALYLLGSSRSFRHVRLPELIKDNEHSAILLGDVESGGIGHQIRLTLENAGRRVELNGKSIKKASELHGRLNSVVFSPDDTAMVKGGPETRRRYLDRAVYMGDVAYLYCWHGYNRILKQRNVLLKKADKSGLDVWTERLAETGAEVIVRRQHYVSLLNGILQQHYEAISGKQDEAACITYRPEGIEGIDQSGIKSELMELISKNRNKDEKYGTTTVGPHRDDLVFNLNGRSLKSLGSQGQQKSFVLALKMAEIDNLKSIFNESPILLLDDFSSELDSERKSNLIQFLNSRALQTFITTTERTSALTRGAEHCAVFHVEHGNLTFKGNESND